MVILVCMRGYCVKLWYLVAVFFMLVLMATELCYAMLCYAMLVSDCVFCMWKFNVS